MVTCCFNCYYRERCDEAPCKPCGLYFEECAHGCEDCEYHRGKHPNSIERNYWEGYFDFEIRFHDKKLNFNPDECSFYMEGA